MGHREKLMAGARRCLEERGYAHTTSRDIAAAADAPLGTINYHYGSKEALLNAAMLESIHEWGAKVQSPGTPAVAAAPDTTGATDDTGVKNATGAPPSVAARLETMWARVIESQVTDRPLLVAATEGFAQAERSPEVRAQIAEAYEHSRPRLAAELHGIRGEEGSADAATARAVGSVHMALVAGLTQQWLVDPEHAPSAGELAAGLRAIARSLDNDG
ncbi:TetR/AcrR family transcriptional regulator [Streptomyces sp. IB2014 016-6]|uniref:TetR/AcrR family transcriptional regulator n=1 Tax=Streptomyces sp. IB2014 016-6 TaxID=2517818 RepID=UPI0016500287|nr:TetR/AcrR family transcriptional regulator [Streptomyces sp. IB2014 016-6]